MEWNIQNLTFTHYIGIFVLGLFAIYIILKLATTQFKVVEGLVGGNTNGVNTPQSYMDILANGDDKTLRTGIEKMNDSLLINKYKSDYEDVLIDLEEIINQNLLYYTLHIASNVDGKTGLLKFSNRNTNTKNGIETDGVSLETLQTLNELYKYKENLNTTMKYIDGK